MKVIVAGGKLQGTEAAYLAKKAGFEVIVLDKNPDVPASGLCDAFFQLDIKRDTAKLAEVIQDASLIIPSLENPEALPALAKAARGKNLPIAYDSESYAITSSKKRSNQLFENLGLPKPKPWPGCTFPVVMKPSHSSGSRDVRKLYTEAELSSLVSDTSPTPDDWIIQEFLEGASYSLEIAGLNGHFLPFQATLIELDRHYDCKRVRAPVALKPSLIKELENMSAKIASSLDLQGIMDVEVIHHEGSLKVLEIDARLPSQTPITVFNSTQINMVETLHDIFTKNVLPSISKIPETKAVILEHIQVSPERISISGEHIMGDAGPLTLCSDFFGADEALTNFDVEKRNTTWVATLIITGESPEDAWTKHIRTIETIQQEFRVPEFIDSFPS